MITLFVALLAAPAAQAECADATQLTPAARMSLSTGRWSTAARSKLLDALKQHGYGSRNYDACQRPLAVLAWNDVVSAGDASARILEAIGKSDCRGGACAQEARLAVADKSPSDLDLLALNTRPQVRPEITELVGALVATGWDVFVATRAPRAIVSRWAPVLGLSTWQVIEAGPALDSTGPISGSALEAVRSQIPPGGRTPMLAISSTTADAALLRVASTALVVTADPELERLAHANGWSVTSF